MKQENVKITPLRIGHLKFRIVGDSDYLPEPMDEQVLERYNKLKGNKVASKDNLTEEEKVKVKYYFTPEGKKGILSRSFFNAMVQASSYFFEKSSGGMRNIKEGVIIKDEVIPLKYNKEEVVEHWGRTSGAKKSPRKILRNAFKNWSCELEVSFDQNNLTAEQIINILNYAGFKIGVGGFRKEKKGTYGLFHVDLKDEA